MRGWRHRPRRQRKRTCFRESAARSYRLCATRSTAGRTATSASCRSLERQSQGYQDVRQSTLPPVGSRPARASRRPGGRHGLRCSRTLLISDRFFSPGRFLFAFQLPAFVDARRGYNRRPLSTRGEVAILFPLSTLERLIC